MFENAMMPPLIGEPITTPAFPLIPAAPPSPAVMTLPDGTVAPVDELMAGAAPDQTLPPGVSPETSPFPMPRPGQPAGGGPQKAPLRPLTDAQKKAMAQLLKEASEMARKGKSPLAAFLVPLASGLMQGIAARRDQQGQADAAGAWKDSTRKMFGGLADDPRVGNLMGIINDENAPAFVRNEARAQLDAITEGLAAAGTPPSGGGTKGGTRGGGTTYRGGTRGGRTYPASGGGKATGDKADAGDKTEMFGEYNIGGFMYGRTRYGELVPYTLPTGERIPFGGSADLGSEALQPTADPGTGLLPGTGPMLTPPVGEGVPLDLPDPLGIRLPPA